MYTFTLLRMTDTVTSHNVDLSNLDTLYNRNVVIIIIIIIIIIIAVFK
jgi:hypothetical protein